MTRITGGCQCGAVRYALSSVPTDVDLCHCRMCQKATGGAFLAAGGVPRADFSWTRGAPATFRSSSVAARDFCAACGTPLTFRYLDKDRISVTLGSLDVPDAVPPTQQLATGSRMAWWDRVSSLPVRPPGEDEPELAARIVSYQHPDHDTDAGWHSAAPRS